MLVVDVCPEVLFQCLVDSFCLSVSLQVITGGEAKSYVQGSSERAKEVEHKLGAPVRGDVGGNSMLGEDVDDEESSKSGGVNVIHGEDEYTLLRESVHNYENSRGTA